MISSLPSNYYFFFSQDTPYSSYSFVHPCFLGPYLTIVITMHLHIFISEFNKLIYDKDTVIAFLIYESGWSCRLLQVLALRLSIDLFVSF